MIKSPFLIFQDFLSQANCNEISQLTWADHQLDAEGLPQPVQRSHSAAEDVIFDQLSVKIPEIEAHYGFKYKGTEHMIFQQFPATGKIAEEPHAENAVYKRKRWVRVRERDLTGILWLRDYKSEPPFDLDQHVYGGKLEFPVYNFGFQPQRGTLVIYPSNERFISLTTAVLVGSLHCVKIHMVGEGIWIYQPDAFPGDFRTWFANVV